MRISDWSSDVCSSDLEVPDNAGAVETLRKKIEEELTAHFDALDLSRTQIAGRRDHILQPVDRPDLGPVDDPVRDVAIEGDITDRIINGTEEIGRAHV